MAKYICGNQRIPEPGDSDFEDYIFKVAAQESPYLCPFCGAYYDPNDAEYIHIDMGHYQQVTGSHCEDCGAYELGCYKMNEKTQVYLHGWVRDREPDDGNKYPAPEGINDDPFDSILELDEETP